VIAKQTGKTYEKVLADMERDFWMNAAEAVEYGIVSRVIESSRELTLRSRNSIAPALCSAWRFSPRPAPPRSSRAANLR